jgi:hypothetical protein
VRASAAILLAVAVTTGGCVGSADGPATLSSTSTRPRPSAAATYAGAARACPRRTSYTPAVSPAHGPAGTRVTVTGTLPLYGEDGTLSTSSTARLVGWWNVGIAHWTGLARTPPTILPARPGPAFRIIDVAVPAPNPCTYRIVIRVPRVAAGGYPIDILDVGGDGVATLPTATFTVTAR